MSIASSFLLPTVVRYVLPALLLLLFARPWLPALGDLEAAGILLLLAFGLVPVLESISEALATLDPRFITLIRVAGWYWRNWDVSRMFTLATKEERERAEYGYAFVKFYNMSAMLLFSYGLLTLVYDVVMALTTTANFFEVDVPLLAPGWTKPAWLVGVTALLLALFIHIYFLDRFLDYYENRLLQLATVAEANYGEIALAICGRLRFARENPAAPAAPAEAVDSRGWPARWRRAAGVVIGRIVSALKIIAGAFSRPFTSPVPAPLQVPDLAAASVKTLLTKRLKVVVSHPRLLGENRTCPLDVYGRYSLAGVPHGEEPYTLKLIYEDDEGNYTRVLCTWSQRHADSKSDCLKEVKVRASMLRELWLDGGEEASSATW